MALVELVSVQTSDGLRLDGALRRPKVEQHPALAVDAVIMHHAKDGNFYSSGLFSHLQESFAAAGCAVLRVNNRGREVLPSPGARLPGGAGEIIDDCRIDVRAWLDFSEMLGYRRVALWGHSLGAVKTVYYQSLEHDDRVKCIIASSPPRLSFRVLQANATKLAQTLQERIQQDQQKVQDLYDGGEANALTQAVPLGTTTPRHYLDMFGLDERYDILRTLPSVDVPVLVTFGSREVPEASEVVLQGPSLLLFLCLNGLVSDMEALGRQMTNSRLALIPGANHFYDGAYDELWQTAREWVTSLS
jgi:pimeloyl-ACP methyl ester carboxylesterase